jgi:hypothetical protein
MFRLVYSPTRIWSAWSTPVTNGFFSALVFVNAISSSLALRHPTWQSKRHVPRSSARVLTPDDIDFIVVGTTTPDMLFPSTACLVQERLGANHAWGIRPVCRVLWLHRTR